MSPIRDSLQHLLKVGLDRLSHILPYILQTMMGSVPLPPPPLERDGRDAADDAHDDPSGHEAGALHDEAADQRAGGVVVGGQFQDFLLKNSERGNLS